MGVVYGVLVAVCGLVGALGVVLSVLPARQSRLRGWLDRAGVEHDDAAVLAVQAALGRVALAAAAAFVVLTLAFLALGLKAVALALALPLAALLTASLPVGGGARRHASLTAVPRTATPWRLLLVVAVGGLGVASALLRLQHVALQPPRGRNLSLDVSTVLPELSVHQLPERDVTGFAVLAVIAVAVPLLLAAVLAVLARRPGLSGAPGAVDVRLRQHHVRLAVHAALAAELVLAGVLVRYLPLLGTPTDEMPGTAAGGGVEAAGVLALVLVVVALGVLVRGAAFGTDARASASTAATTP